MKQGRKNPYEKAHPEAGRGTQRSTVLEKTGSMPANDLVKSFLGRPQAIDAFKGWMNQEFQGLPAGSQPSGQ